MKSRIAFLSLTVLLTLTRPCLAEHNFILADRSDEYIHNLTAQLLHFVVDYPSPPAEGAVILKQGLYLEATHHHYSVCENYILYVFNPDAEGITEQTLTVPLDRSLKNYGGWIRRANGTLERLTTSQIRVLDPGKGQDVEVLFPFPSVEKGDILSWSVESEGHDLLLSYNYLLSNPFPAEYAVSYVITDGETGYRLAVHNVMEDSFSSEVKQKKHGAPSIVKFTFVDIPAFSKKDHSLPLQLREPFLLVSYRGTYYKETGQWLYIKSWPQLALSVDDLLTEAFKANRVVRSKARALTVGAQTEQEKIEALYRFTRDQIDPLSTNEVSTTGGMPASVLNNGSGNFMEKGLLLGALLNAIDIPVNIGFARSRDSGAFDAQFPSFEQFDSMVVEAPQSSGKWYDPNCLMCPAGQLPISLDGVEAFIPKIGLEKANEKLLTKVEAEVGGSERVFIRKYLEQIAKAPWCTFKSLPSSPQMNTGTTTEVAVYDPQSKQSRLHLSSDGFTEVCSLARALKNIEALADTCVSKRFKLENLDRYSLSSSPEDVEANHVELELTFTPKADITLAHDVCILPSELVFGNKLMPAWDGPDRRAFYTATTENKNYEWRMPLFQGWKGLSKPQSLVRDFGPLHYSAQIRVVNDSLLVTRSLKMDQGTIYEENLQGLDEVIQAIRAFEARSITLEKGDGPSGT